MPATSPRRRGTPRPALAVARTATVLLSLAACAPHDPAPTPVPDTGKRAVASHGMVASAQPLASEAGLEMLRRGGNAVDAAVATAFAIGVVEPMMSGLGAGGGILIWPSATRHPVYIDFYSTAPANPVRPVRGEAGPADAKGAAIPGGVAGLLLAQKEYGRLPRAVVLEPAIRLARDGFPVHSLLARIVAEDSAKLSATTARAASSSPTATRFGPVSASFSRSSPRRSSASPRAAPTPSTAARSQPMSSPS